VQRNEVGWARSGGADGFYLGIEEWLKSVGDRVVLLEGEEEVRPGITAMPNGGHTPGHQSVLVHTEDGPVCLCGDIVPMSGNRETPPPACYDPAATRAFLELARRAGWEMLPGHDPALRAHRWTMT
jgi:glyoxylase-like metal-dependent hydrolase (beta-lactamase superfamily II)